MWLVIEKYFQNGVNDVGNWFSNLNHRYIILITFVVTFKKSVVYYYLKEELFSKEYTYAL